MKRYLKRSLLTTLLSGAAMSAIIVSTTYAQTAVQSNEIAFDIKQTPISQALKEFAEQANLQVMYAGTELASDRLISLKGRYKPLEALAIILENTGFDYLYDGKNNIAIRSMATNTGSAFQKISYNTAADYQSDMAVYEEDERADEETVGFEEIVVTASRREQILQDVPMAITSINPDDFVGVGLTSLENIIDYTPGINFNSGGNAGFGSITIRAVSQESFIPVTAVYIDDVPLTTSSPFSAGNTLFLDGLLGDVERIEIIKGPQGTLYGASSMGGLIRYITKDPALEEMRGSASADISKTQEGGFSQLYRAMISAPIITDKFGITVSGFYNDKAGFNDRLDPFTLELADENYNVAEVYGINVTGLFKFSDDVSLRLSGMYQKSKTSGNDVVLFSVADVDNIVLVPLNGKYEFATPDPGHNDLEYKKADMTFKYAFEWAEFTSVTGYAEYLNPVLTDLITGNEGYADFVTASPAGTSKSIPVNNIAGSQKIIQEFRLSSSNNDTFEWQVGLFYSKEETTSDQFASIEPQGLILNDTHLPSDYEEKAAFANVTYYVTPNFDITAGVRYSEPSLTVNMDASGASVVNIKGKFDVAENVTTYLFNARWRIEENLSLYARVASGYRPAFVNLPAIDADTGQIATTIVNADSLWSYELGAKGKLLEGRFTYDVALWAMQWDDFQATVALNALVTGGNAGVGQSSHGFEGTFKALLTDQLSVQTTFAYTKSTLDADSGGPGFENGGVGAVAGEKTRNLPDWTASIRAIYDYTIGEVDASVGFGVRYVGKFNTDYIGDASRGIGYGNTRLFPIEEVVLADLNADFTKDNYTLSLYVTNLFNNYAFSSGGISVLSGSASARVVRPRTMGASIAVSF